MGIVWPTTKELLEIEFRADWTQFLSTWQSSSIKARYLVVQWDIARFLA